MQRSSRAVSCHRVGHEKGIITLTRFPLTAPYDIDVAHVFHHCLFVPASCTSEAERTRKVRHAAFQRNCFHKPRLAQTLHLTVELKKLPASTLNLSVHFWWQFRKSFLRGSTPELCAPEHKVVDQQNLFTLRGSGLERSATQEAHPQTYSEHCESSEST